MMKYRMPLGSFGSSGPLNKKGIGNQGLPSHLFPKGKRGFELQFHWIFIMIAGAIILAFFFSVAQKQKAISDERLQLTLATEIENIFTGAIVARGAKKLPVPPQGIDFKCEVGCDCNFFIERAPRQFGTKAMFAPERIDSTEMVVWTQELKVPYRATNFLYLTSPDVKYYFVYDEDGSAAHRKLKEITKTIPPFIEFQIVELDELMREDAQEYQHTRFVFVDPEEKITPQDIERMSLHPSFTSESASAVKIEAGKIWFYKKPRKTNSLRLDGIGLSYVGMPSIFAAIFSHDKIMYECGLKIAFKKLSYVSLIIAERAAELEEKALTAGMALCSFGATSKTCRDLNPGFKCDGGAKIMQLLCRQHELGKSLSTKLDIQKISELDRCKLFLDAENRNLAAHCPELF